MKNDKDVSKEINKVLKFQDNELKNLESGFSNEIDSNISSSEKLLCDLGYDISKVNKVQDNTFYNRKIEKKNWKELCELVNKEITGDVEIESLFTSEELKDNKEQIKKVNDDFNSIYQLDTIDVAISAFGCLLSSAFDIFFIGLSNNVNSAQKSFKIDEIIKNGINKCLPQNKINKLENMSKTSFDAQDNRNTKIRVEGLSSFYHRIYEIGHDPMLGFIYGVRDILSGEITTIDKNGKWVVQVIKVYDNRKACDIFAAFGKEFLHLLSDVNTSRGLPMPLMTICNLFQFGKIDYNGAEKTIAELAKEMYDSGFDFRYFLTQSLSVIILETFIRICYAFKRKSEGYDIKDCVPLSLNRDKNPKLPTMLFIGHSGAAAFNAGKVYFKKDPLSVNYAEWLAFAKYSYSQLKWVLIEKPEKSDKYVMDYIDKEKEEVYGRIDDLISEFEFSETINF